MANRRVVGRAAVTSQKKAMNVRKHAAYKAKATQQASNDPNAYGRAFREDEARTNRRRWFPDPAPVKR